MAKLEKSIQKTGEFLIIFKKVGATITATILLYQLLECD